MPTGNYHEKAEELQRPQSAITTMLVEDLVLLLAVRWPPALTTRVDVPLLLVCMKDAPVMFMVPLTTIPNVL